MVEFIIGYIIGSNKDCPANMSLDTCGALSLEKIMLIGFVVFVISFAVWFILPEAIGFLWLSILFFIFGIMGLFVKIGSLIREMI